MLKSDTEPTQPTAVVNDERPLPAVYVTFEPPGDHADRIAELLLELCGGETRGRR